MANTRLTVLPASTVTGGGWNRSTTGGTGASASNSVVAYETILANPPSPYCYSAANFNVPALTIQFAAVTIPTGGQVRGAFVAFTGEYAQGTGSAAGSTMAITLFPSFPIGTGGSSLGVTNLTMSTVGSSGGGTSTTYTTYGGARLTPTQVSGMQASFKSSGPSEGRLYSATLYVDYNMPPSSTPFVTGIVAGVVPTLTPTFTWTYTDPESDAQERYRIKVYLQSNLFSPIWDSGEVFSSLNTATMPFGILQNYTAYRVAISVSDAGSSGRYNLVNWSIGTGAVDTALDFSTGIDPLLMPSLRFPTSPANPALSFSPSNGAITPIMFRSRVNLLTATDASLVSGTSPNVGSWVVNSSGGTSTVTAANTLAFRGPSSLVLTASSSTGTSTGAKTGPYTAVAGQLLTAMAKVGGATASSAATISIAFYSDLAATVLIDTATSSPQATYTTAYTTLHVTTRAPKGTSTCRVFITLASANSATYEAGCISLSPNVNNLLDDASFENNGDVFWITSTSGGNSVDVSSRTPPTGASWDFSRIDARLARLVSGAGSALIATKAELALVGLKYMVSADFLYESGTPSTATCQFGFVMDDLSTVPASIVSVTGLNHAQVLRKSVLADASALSASRHGYLFIQPDAGIVQTIRVDNVAVELIWPFTDGTFESSSYPSSTALAITLPFGQLSHYWMKYLPVGSTSTAVIDNGAFHSGTKSLLLTINAGNVGAEQYFTVSGYSSITLDWWVEYTNSNSSTFIQFYDNAGTILSTLPTGTTSRQTVIPALQIDTRSGTQASFIHVTPAAIPVPYTAAYARLVFSADSAVTAGTSTVRIDDVTMTPTGTLSSSLPWIDGGWSGGGHSAGASALVQNSSDGGNTWRGVRVPPSTSSALTPVSLPDFELPFTDYEWAEAPVDVSQTLLYRAASVFTGGINIQTPYSTSATNISSPSFQPYEWLLIDPVDPTSNVALQVKTAKFETPETLGTFVGSNRNRRVIIGDTVLGEHITLTLITVLPAQHVALTAQINKQQTLLLRSPGGYMWYVRCVKRSNERNWTGTYTKPLRTYTVEFDEVDILP